MWFNQILVTIFIMVFLIKDTGDTSALDFDMLNKALP